MNNHQIELYLTHYNVKVICADELPSFVKRKPAAFVVNTDPCSLKGTHWIVFYFPGNGAPCEFFDFLGHKPEFYHPRFKDVLTINACQYQYLIDRLQALNSDSTVSIFYCNDFMVEVC